MPLMSGSIACTRYRVQSCPSEPTFDDYAFREIPPGSEVRDRAGFVPMEPEAPYEIGARRFAFRVRVDTVRPDATAVRERLQQLVRTELETSGLPFVGSKKRKHLKELAEEELLPHTTPKTRIVEAVVDGDTLYVFTTATTMLGRVLVLARQAGIVVEPWAPWLDGKTPEVESPIVEAKEPGASVHGCRYLRELVGDRELTLEPVQGSVRLQTPEAKVTLSGAVLPEVLRYLERGAELISAKLTTGELGLRLDALNFRVSGLAVETSRHDHWTERLEERLGGVVAAWDLLDRKFEDLRPEILRG
ncbi:MAG: hypothetical protein AAGD01_08570 [Acidobacteriota bacterium]